MMLAFFVDLVYCSDANQPWMPGDDRECPRRIAGRRPGAPMTGGLQAAHLSPRVAVTADSRRGAGEGRRSGSEHWYDATWNPTVGCSAGSPGCDRCTALRTVAELARIGGKSGARYAGIARTAPGAAAWTGAIVVHADLLTWPLFRREASRVLVGSLSDLFHERLAAATLDRIHAVIALADWHRFLVLTKRARRMREYYSDTQTPHRIAVEIDRLGIALLERREGDAAPGGARLWRRWRTALGHVLRRSAPAGDPIGLEAWPLPNLFPGVSVEDEARLGRVADLAQMPAAMRWACFEPLLGPVRIDSVPVDGGYFDALLGLHCARGAGSRVLPIAGRFWPALDWVAAGGEVGRGARAASPDWVRRLRDRCAEAGVPFFFNQWGEWAPAPEDGYGERMVRVGRRAAGRLVDGRSWDLLPAQLRPQQTADAA
jgi:protein gp37